MKKYFLKNTLRASFALLLAITIAYALFSFIMPAQKVEKAHDIRQERRKLYHDLYQNGGLIIYSASNKSLSGKYFEAAERLKKNFEWVKLKIVPDTEVSIEELKSSSIILIGTERSNKILKQLSGSLPVKFLSGGFIFNGENFNNAKDVLKLLYFNPFNKDKICFVVTGINDDVILKNLNMRLISDYQILRGSETMEMGFFKSTQNNNWVIDDSSSRNFFEERKVYNKKYFRYIVYSKKISPEDVNKVDSTNNFSIDRLKNFFGSSFRINKTNYFLYDNFEDKGLISGNTNLTNVDWSDSSIHSVLNNWINGTDFSQNALLYIKQNAGSPKINFLENGLSIYFSHDWRKYGFKYWAGFVTASDAVPPLAELLDNAKLKFVSNLISEPLAGTFTDFLIKKWGREKFIKNYPAWKPDKNEVESLEAEWRKYLNDLSKDYVTEIRNYRKDFYSVIPAFQKGFCFAHEGYQIHNGYLSRDAYRSLQKLVSLGVNSISITPFTSMRFADKPEPLSFWEFAGAENDESLIYLSHITKELNLNVILKPHIYLGESSWPGNIKMKSDEDWRIFFHNYYNWIIHYAMLAEMYKIPMFCIGNELSNATVGHEEEWIKLIKSIRKVYDGKLVYGPNWSNEFEKISFWKYLDYIGLSEYFPLSDKNNPSQNDLDVGAEKIMERVEAVHEKYNKPVIFTEVGFRSTEQPWKTALENDDKEKINLQAQAECYEAIFKAAKGKKWLAGMYWWKWSSYLAYGDGANNSEYTPNDKPAMYVVKKYFSGNYFNN